MKTRALLDWACKLRLLSMRAAVLAVALAVFASGAVAAAEHIEGEVEGGGGGGPIAKSTVTLWAAGPSAPRKLGETQTHVDGRFDLPVQGTAKGEVLYLVAIGGEPKVGGGHGPNNAIGLMATLGAEPPQRVVINELTTVASMWTGVQFLNRTVLSGNALGLRIAAGNVPNLVDLQTGGLGPVIQDPLNSSQTTTMAIFSTLSDLLAGCITRVSGDACGKLFAAATPAGGAAPTDTLSAAEAIARRPWLHPARLFALLDAFYPIPQGQRWHPAPFRPYLSYAPVTWTLALVYAGGGLNSLGGIAIDGEGNAWAGDNFLVGTQSTAFSAHGGGLSELASNGQPISPMTFGYQGGGVDGPGFGLAIAADDKVWVTSLGGQSIAVFDRKAGKPLSPQAGYNFNGKLGAMQGIISTPDSDVWALDNDNDQVVYFPKGDPAQARLLCRTVGGKPTDGTCQVKGPFHLAIDQRNRIWITNGNARTVTRFPASNPAQAESLKVGFSPKAIAIDSQGNAWVNNALGSPRSIKS